MSFYSNLEKFFCYNKETVELFDAASKESIFREIQDLVVKKEFNLNILGQEDVILVSNF